MKQVLRFLWVMVLVLPVVALAQSPREHKERTAEERATKWTAWMKKELSFTEGQESAVHSINLAYAQKVDSVRAATSDRATLFQHVKDIDRAKDAALKPVLTEQQFTLYQEKKQERQKKMVKSARSRRGHGGK